MDNSLSQPESANSEELNEQVRMLFAAYARVPNEDELVAYQLEWDGLTVVEIEHGIRWAKRQRPEDELYRAPPDAELILRQALSYRESQRVANAPRVNGKCGKCGGSGFKAVNDQGQEVSWNTYPRRVTRCDCRQAVTSAG